MGNTDKISTIIRALIPWFLKNARDLPWRREPYCNDPYSVYVSEIMLQQTQVKTVIPYWERWMRELPTVKSAAKASPARLHKLWEGLGYYTRVRNLRKAAQLIVVQHEGRFPQDFDDILALPGIGRYTAGAIASIAFNQPRAILDGNVIRVLTRIFGINTDPRERKTNARLWQLAEELVLHASLLTHQPSLCSHLNQSLMELGALICTARSPRCGACPVNKLCAAQKQNLQEQLPNLGKREAVTVRRFFAFVVERDGKFLVRQRPDGVVNAHLWEFPNVEIGAAAGRVHQPAAGRFPTVEQQRAGGGSPLQATDFRPTSAKPLCTIKHSITRYRITLEAYRAERANPRAKPSGQWLSLPHLHRLAFTSAHKTILKVVAADISTRKTRRRRVNTD